MSPLYVAHPEWVAPLALVILGALGLLAGARGVARRRRRRLLGSPAPVGGDARLADAVLVGAVLAVAVALAGPRLGEREVRVPATGVDVVFVLDVSRSMDASDVPPSRLDRARRGMNEMVARLAESDRAALVAFAGRGVLLAPLTPDHQALRELASGIDSDLVEPRGSDLGAGLRAALEAFEAASERPRAVFVLSDGEDPEARDTGAAQAARRQVRVHAAAIGSDAGATLPDHGVPLVDRTGRVVVSRRDRERLRALAEATGGAFFAGDRFGRFDADAAVAAVRRDAAADGAGPGDMVVRRVRAVQVAPFAALAFALLLLEALPRGRPRTRGRAPRGATLAALVAVVAAPGVPTATARSAEAQQAGPAAAEASPRELEDALRERPGDPYLLNALGIARLERGRHQAAARAFLAASVAARSADPSATALFNLGVTALEAGELEEARDAFFDALALAPDDARARFNLEWTLRALEQQPPPRPESEPGEEPPPPEDEPRDPAEREEVERPSRPEDAEAEPAPAPLDEARLRERLDRIEDDPGAALRAATRGEGDRGRRRGAPQW